MFAMSFLVQIWMYLTPIVYPFSQVPEQYRIIYAINPMVSSVELFRAAFFGVSSIEPIHLILSLTVTFIVLIAGVIMFSRLERTFMDTV
jgi:lipopolysaccharide transport system permease protein